VSNSVNSDTCPRPTTQDVTLTLEPGFTDDDCANGLALLAPQLTEFCCEDGTTFEALLQRAGAGPAACGFDCAHTWSTYVVGCGTFLQHK
jgi:hypothetical protein